METIEIVYTIDDNCVQPCYASIKSIACHTKNSLLIHIISNGTMMESNRQELSKLETPQLHIDFTVFDERSFYDFPVGGHTCNDNIPYTAYFRLYACRYFDAEKMIYVDADTLFLADIVSLWNYDISNYLIASVPDLDATQRKRKPVLNIPSNEQYINSGLLVMNLKKMRECYFFEEAHNFALQYPEKIYFHDQDILNALCHGKILYLPYRWNMISDYLRKKPKCSLQKQLMLKEDQLNPSMIHFAGEKKPWEGGCRNPFQKQYRAYLEQSSWHKRHRVWKDKRFSVIQKYFFYKFFGIGPYVKY